MSPGLGAGSQDRTFRWSRPPTGFYSSLRERTGDRVIGRVESADTDRR